MAESRGLIMQTKYAVVEHYPDGNSSIIATFTTEKQAQDYIARNHYDLCTVKQVQTMTIF
jgi:hypothetical protein